MENIFYGGNNIKKCTRSVFFKNIKNYLSEFQFKFLEKIDSQIVLYNNPSYVIYTIHSIKYLWFPESYLEDLEKIQGLSINAEYLTLQGNEITVLEIYTSNKYLTFSNWCSDKISYIPKLKLFAFPIKDRYSKSVRLDIYDTYNIYFHGRGKTFPMTLKALDYINKEEFKYLYCVIDLLFEYELKDNIFWKDILSTPYDWRTNVYPPIKFSELQNIHNKKQLLEKKFKTTLPNAINKFSLTEGYYKVKAALLLKESERQKIYNLEIKNNFISFFYSEQDRINKIFQIYYKEKFNQDFSRLEEYYIGDYITMSTKLKTPISLNFKTLNGIIREHDKIAEQVKLNDMPEIKISSRTPFKRLKLPEKYELIKTKERLYQETVMNCNCVWSYADKINNGDCMIYSLLENGNRYTIEINIDYENKFFLGQMFGYKNSSCPPEYIDELIGYLEEINEDKTYE